MVRKYTKKLSSYKRVKTRKKHVKKHVKKKVKKQRKKKMTRGKRRKKTQMGKGQGNISYLAKLGKKPKNKGLQRWFREQWVNVCEVGDGPGGYAICGSGKSADNPEQYPYCRAYYKYPGTNVVTAPELTYEEIDTMCNKKRSLEQGIDGKPTRIVLPKKTRSRVNKKIMKQKKKPSKQTKTHQLNKYIGGSLCPQNNSAEDIYELKETAKCEGSQTWLLYKDVTRDDVIIKKLGPANWLKEDAIMKEIEATTKAGDLGIGPEVVFSTICHEERGEKSDVVGYIVMKFIQGRTLKIEDLQDKGIVDEINILLLKMHENSMKHNDLHNGNIMIGYTKKADDATSTKQVELINDRVWIIDHSGIKPNDDSPLTHLHIEWNDD